MLTRMELWLIDQLDRVFGMEWLARRAGFSAEDAKRIAQQSDI
jgi:hypothetical protein